jgi:putative two-component system response regulator
MQIVIVDDNETNLTLLRGLIDKMGDCSALSFLDPQACLERCKYELPDLVITNYTMPGLSGVELVRLLRALPEWATIPILMTLPGEQSGLRHAAIDAGVNDFLSKPLDTVEFMARVRNMLALRAGQKHLEDRASWLAEEVSKATEKIVNRERETILRLSRAAEFRDPETGAHVQRMAHYSWLIAARLGVSPEELQLMLEAAPMHDIGKVGIPDHILLKPGRLDKWEFEIMKQHTEMGHRILSGSDSPLLQVAAEIALNHHEKYDGSGYPRSLVGTAIPLCGRIVAVADVFDALTSERPFKRAWQIDQAVEYLQDNSGSHFDPECVAAFLQNFDEVLAVRARFQEVVVHEDIIL